MGWPVTANNLVDKTLGRNDDLPEGQTLWGPDAGASLARRLEHTANNLGLSEEAVRMHGHAQQGEVAADKRTGVQVSPSTPEGGN